jgi:glycerophosphoryl diester phosphodiesterase
MEGPGDRLLSPQPTEWSGARWYGCAMRQLLFMQLPTALGVVRMNGAATATPGWPLGSRGVARCAAASAAQRGAAATLGAMKLTCATLTSTLLLLAASPAAGALCPTNCGHRGTGKSSANAPFPENTIPSFQQAVAEGAETVELDVIHSADGVLVAIHDDTVDRTTDGSGCVGDMTVAELQALDAGFGTAMEGQGVVIPTLAEVLAAVQVPLNVELKIDDGGGCPASDKPRMAADLVSEVTAAGAGDRVVASSFDEDVLVELKALDPTFYAGFLTFAAADAQTAADRGFDALNLRTNPVDEAAVTAVHDLGLELNVWTVNDPARMEELVALGVDSIITDEPDLYAAVQASCPEDPTPSGGGGAGGDGGAGAGGDGAASQDEGGCALSTPARPTPPWSFGAALVAVALLARRRRR